ncbi:MAG: RagB/SusD family nutrient uptake outer membrane protein [Bacteroidales bacterium]|nr:RagB/SusD family nutrient uptake outer membrane protein [Bacteroidales bacterium]
MKTMRSIRYLLLAVPMALLLLWSCEDWLELEPVAMDSPDNLKGEPIDNMKLALATAYNSVTYVYPWGASNWVAFNCASGDVNTGGGAAGDRIEYEEMEHFDQLNSASLSPQYLWEKNFRGIRSVNQMLVDYRDFSSETVDRVKAESRILRSYFYFDMVRLFGDVPYFTEDTSYNVDGVRIPADEVLDSLINTINTNVHLVKRKSANGTMTYDAAYVLLAKIYMWKEDYVNAAAALDTVILSNKFSLLSSYADVFNYLKPRNAEVIFCTNPQNIGNPSSWDNFTSLFNIDMKLAGIRDFVDTRTGDDAIVNGWGFVKPRKELVDAYIAAGDIVRLNENIWLGDETLTDYADYFTEKLYERSQRTDGVLSYAADVYGYEGFFRKKYTNYEGYERAGDWVRATFLIYRYSDVLLLRAECALNGGGGDADAYINEVRARVSLDPLSGATMDDVKLERRLELAFEYDRYFDLVRWGDAATVLAAQGYDPAKNGLFPVPQTEIDLSGGILTQNPGY